MDDVAIDLLKRQLCYNPGATIGGEVAIQVLAHLDKVIRERDQAQLLTLNSDSPQVDGTMAATDDH